MQVVPEVVLILKRYIGLLIKENIIRNVYKPIKFLDISIVLWNYLAFS